MASGLTESSPQLREAGLTEEETRRRQLPRLAQWELWSAVSLPLPNLEPKHKTAVPCYHPLERSPDLASELPVLALSLDPGIGVAARTGPWFSRHI